MYRKYKALQPAPTRPDLSSRGQGPGRQRPILPKRSYVSQACDACRQAKAKCDGAHPVCYRCTSRNLACSYSKDEQKQRDEAMKTRLETLEELFSTLQTQSPEEIHRTMQSIRSAGDIKASPGNSSLQSRPIGTSPPSPPSPQSQDEARSSSSTSCGETTDEDAVAGSTGAKDVQFPHNAAGFGLPDASVVAEAVAAFYDFSGPLFHVFTRPQALALCSRVYYSTNPQDRTDSMRADVACVAAIACVGAQYTNRGIDDNLDVHMYEIARRNFEAVLEERPFDAIKISALLAMFNIMTKATTAITYVEIGLSMARRQGVDWPVDRNASALACCKTAWRTLMFFSCWLSSTLGYVSGNDVWFGNLPLSSFNAEDPANMQEVVQAEMTKISMLKARVLRLQMSFKGESIMSFESVMKEFQDWYNLLPSPMKLNNLVQQGGLLPDSVWGSICHTHLLYLGAIMLLHRRTVFQRMEMQTSNIDDHDELLADKKTDIRNSIDGIAAAKHSATILKLLLERKMLFKRCWLIIFQSYTSCIAILHSVSQKQMHNFPKNDWSSDLEQGNLCISVLQFCGELDPVANRFRERLVAIYTKLFGHQPVEGTFKMLGQENTDNYLFEVPEDAHEDQKRTSWTLLNLLCKPFNEPADRVDSEEHVRKNFAECPLRHNHSFYTQLIEQLQWKCESAQPFNWDVHSLVGCEVGGVNNEQQGHMFIGSAEPHHWEEGPRVMRPGWQEDSS